MSFGERLRAWFKGESKRAAAPSSAPPSNAATRDLDEFLTSRAGIEGFLEPKTAIYSTTLLLVAADGEYLRRPVRDKEHAVAVCGKFGVPLYDASKVGYPKRMRDYDAGVRREGVRLEDLPPWPDDDAAGEPPAVGG